MKDINQFPLWTAIITPLGVDGRVDYESLQRIVRIQEDSGNGIVLLGSTGEALNLDLNEKKSIVSYVCKLRPTVPIIVGAGAHNIRAVFSWLQYLEDHPVSGYMFSTPMYAKPEDIGQYKWFRALLDYSSRPCILYNVPGRTAKELSLEAVRKLSSHQNFWAIKEASGTIENYKEYKSAIKGQKLFSGDDGMLPAFSEISCDGLISVAANVWPKAINTFVQKCLDNDLSGSQRIVDACASLFHVSNPIPVKALMYKKEIINSPYLRLPLDHEDLKEMQNLLDADSTIKNWLKENIQKEIHV